MGKTSKIPLLKEIFYIILISMLGCIGIVFSVLYIDTFSSGFWFDNSTILTAVTVSIISTLTVLTITFFNRAKHFIYKLFLLVVAFIAILTVFLYILNVFGVLDKIDTVDELRACISSFGSYAVVLFIIIQFLQVVVLPLPSFITVGAGVLLFGPFYGSIYSCLGIILGSIVAFLIGRIFGFKVARWLVGDDSLEKGLKTIKGKDKIVLTFMFLFPFFPDDVLCFVAGITTVSVSYFVSMTFIVRIITVFISSYSMNNSIIPYDTWWGILLWVLFFVVTALLTYLVYKKGDKIEKLIFKKRKKISK